MELNFIFCDICNPEQQYSGSLSFKLAGSYLAGWTWKKACEYGWREIEGQQVCPDCCTRIVSKVLKK